MSFYTFLFEQGIISVTIGTIAALAVTNLTKDIHRYFIDTILMKTLNIKNTFRFEILGSFIEFVFLMAFIYFLYIFLLYPLFKDDITRENKAKQRDQKWKENVLQELRSIDGGVVYM